MRFANNVGNAGPHVRQTFLNDVFTFLTEVGNLFEICFHFAGHRSSSQGFSAGTSEFLLDLHFLCKIVLKPSNVIPLLLNSWLLDLCPAK
jgi:hypothetical protein